jgi:hypothetical protein
MCGVAQFKPLFLFTENKRDSRKLDVGTAAPSFTSASLRVEVFPLFSQPCEKSAVRAARILSQVGLVGLVIDTETSRHAQKELVFSRLSVSICPDKHTVDRSCITELTEVALHAQLIDSILVEDEATTNKSAISVYREFKLVSLDKVQIDSPPDENSGKLMIGSDAGPGKNIEAASSLSQVQTETEAKPTEQCATSDDVGEQIFVVRKKAKNLWDDDD